MTDLSEMLTDLSHWAITGSRFNSKSLIFVLQPRALFPALTTNRSHTVTVLYTESNLTGTISGPRSSTNGTIAGH